MRYIIGDIHANIQEMESLLRCIELKDGDSIIFLGDYVDCSPHAKEALDLLSALDSEYDCIFIKGNHEFIWERYLQEGELMRQEFLLTYGGKDTARSFGEHIELALEQNNIPVLKEALRPYLDIIEKTKDWHIVDDYLALHAGLLPGQYDAEPLVFEEANFFVRPQDIPMDKKYLNKYTLVAGHNYLSDEPIVEEGYINIDLGSRNNKYIGAFAVEDKRVIRSDGKSFSI